MQITVNPCALCARLLKHELEIRGQEAMGRLLAPLLERCPTCRQQLPTKPGFHLGSKLKLNLPKD